RRPGRVRIERRPPHGRDHLLVAHRVSPAHGQQVVQPQGREVAGLARGEVGARALDPEHADAVLDAFRRGVTAAVEDERRVGADAPRALDERADQLMERIVARQAPRGACTSTVSPRLCPRSAAPSGEVGETVPAPPTALTSTVLFSPPPSPTPTTGPIPTSSPLASSTISAWSSRARRLRMRASSSPCSFFAAWYSKFSDRSPNSRAFLIAATTSVRRG